MAPNGALRPDFAPRFGGAPTGAPSLLEGPRPQPPKANGGEVLFEGDTMPEVPAKGDRDPPL